MGAEQWDAQLGSVADEAARLLESLRRSAGEAQAPPASGPRPDPGTEEAGDCGHACPTGSGEHDPVCQWCPICRGAAVVRSLSPQTLARLADLAALAATVLTDLASARTPPGEEDPDSGAPATRRPAVHPAPSRPIPVRDADDPQEAPRG